jgi:spoIIIJ-associated protein
VSAPQQQTTTSAETTSDDALSPPPQVTGVDSGPDAALPDADVASDDAVVDEVALADDADDADDAVPDGAPAASATRGGRGTRAPADDDLLVREGDVAGDYLERLLDILDVDGDIDLDVEGDRASVAIVGGRLGDLVGPDGAVLEALQELTRLAVAEATGVRSRLMLDVGEYRARRKADLTALAGQVAARVAGSRQPERLAPMNPFERKVVHDVVAGVAGVRSESEGEEPQRRVVVLPEK